VEYVTTLQTRNQQLEAQLGNSAKRLRLDGSQRSNPARCDSTLMVPKPEAIEHQHHLKQIPRGLDDRCCGATANVPPTALTDSLNHPILSQSAAAAAASAGSQQLWPTRVLDNLVPDDIEKLHTAMNDEVIEVSVEASESAPQSECLLKILCNDKRGLLRDTVNALYDLNVDVVRAAANTIDSKISYDIFEIVHKV